MGATGLDTIPHDVQAYMDDCYTYDSPVDGQVRVLASALLKSATNWSSKNREYYAAVEQIRPDGTREVFAMIGILTIEPGHEVPFVYKTMSEHSGPYVARCPMKILALLTATEDENAFNWRQDCYAHHSLNRVIQIPASCTGQRQLI
jgi:hypothetical protein